MSRGPQLERMDRRHASVLVDMAREFHEEGDLRLDPMLDDLDGFFAQADRFGAGRDLGPDLVQQTHFLLLRGERLLGAARLRHRLNDRLHEDGGNIGYEVRKSERGQGYGTAILGFMLEEARRIELSRVLLTVAHDNAPSRRVIEGHGGVADGTSTSPNTGERMVRYWIEL